MNVLFDFLLFQISNFHEDKITKQRIILIITIEEKSDVNLVNSLRMLYNIKLSIKSINLFSLYKNYAN